MGKIKRILTPQEIKERKKAAEQQVAVARAKETANLTPLQKRLVAEMIKNPGLPAVQQIKNAGYKVTEKSKPHHVKKMLDGKLALTMRDFGIFEDDLAKIMADGLQATNIKIVKIRKPDGKEELKYIEVPDYKTRLSYATVALKLGDYFPAKKVKHEGDINVHAFADIDPAVLAQRKEELLAKQNEVKSDYTVQTVDA